MNEVWSVLGASAGGLFPALVWLWFWLREDSAHPEPKRLVALAFFAGSIAVALVIPLEQFAAAYIAAHGELVNSFQTTGQNLTFIIWAAIEELFKFAVAAAVVLWRHEDDEPIDPVIYMVVVALGFAAAENALFLLSPLSGLPLAQTIITGDYRFVGATLLHVLASATIGGSLALSFFKPSWKKTIYLTIGVILSVALHGLFNFPILNIAPKHMVRTFSFVWAGLIALLAFLEFVKRIPIGRSVIK